MRVALPVCITPLTAARARNSQSSSRSLSLPMASAPPNPATSSKGLDLGVGEFTDIDPLPPPRSVAAGFLAPSRACCNAAIIGARWQPLVYTLGAYSGDRSSGATYRLEPLLP